MYSKPSSYYSSGCRYLNILNTKLRHKCSLLKVGLHRVSLANDPACACGWIIEDSMHYILECPFYIVAREQLKATLSFLEEIKIETLLFGDDALSEEFNNKIFQSVQLYIKQTRRFEHHT